MEQNEIMECISELERKIATLPPGRVSEKKVKNKIYYYHRYSQNGERIENYIDFDKVEELSHQIERRKELEAELKALKLSLPAPKRVRKKKENTHEFKTYVRIGEQLVSMSSPVKKYKRRECFKNLSDFVFGEQQDRVFILYGLRRTGKTTLIRQVLLSMTPEQLSKAAFIQIKSKDSLSSVNSDLKYLESQRFKYVFIDEVTLMEDFIEGAALFLDIYATLRYEDCPFRYGFSRLCIHAA